MQGPLILTAITKVVFYTLTACEQLSECRPWQSTSALANLQKAAIEIVRSEGLEGPQRGPTHELM
jgi:hypothetical protein